MNITKFRDVIKERIRISVECQDEWDFGIEQCWQAEVGILSEDISSTIAFLENECTPDEFSWISEVIEDLAEKTKSRELIECYKNLMSRFPEECQKYNISGSVEIAENTLKWEEENAEKS